MTTSQTFYERMDDWIDRLLAMHPVGATQLGDHRFDDRLGAFSLAELEDQNREIKAALAEIEAMSTETWSTDECIDHTVTVQLFKQFVRAFEEQRRHRRDPGQCLNTATGGVMLLIIKDFAPLPERLTAALGRAREVPSLLARGRENLVPEDVPAVWARTALEQGRTAATLFTGLLPSLAQQAAPEQVGDLSRAGTAAARSVEEYLRFIERDVLPQARGDFAVGRKLFDEMLREDHMVDYDAEQLLRTGWEQFEETQRKILDVARSVDPSKDARQLLEEAKADHPTAGGLLDAYREAMDATRRFVVDHRIATIPDGESLTVIETPAYMRPLLPYAAYMPPGIFEGRQDGLFLVTPVDPNAPAAQREQKLKGHYRAKLPITTLHEGYPGHHLQQTWANRTATLPRRLASLLSTLFIEGWAFYCEELMESLGYISSPIQRLGRLSDQLWRAARIILDVSLHTGGMSVDEAIDFLVEKCQLEPANAAAEVHRYAGDPTQPQSYLMGKLEILEIVRELKAARPNASLCELHDAILGAGSLPPRLMRQALFGR